MCVSDLVVCRILFASSRVAVGCGDFFISYKYTDKMTYEDNKKDEKERTGTYNIQYFMWFKDS